jgi:hypothetical protein
MSISMYDLSVVPLTRGLDNLAAILDKAQAFAEHKKIDPAVLAAMRLYPDMLPLSKQVQIACDMAKGAAARLANFEVPKHEDTETTLLDLKSRVAKARAVVQSATPAQLFGADSREIVLQTSTITLKFNGLSYLTGYVLPNFHFHSSMTYALLRHVGVEIGKKDYLGAIQ